MKTILLMKRLEDNFVAIIISLWVGPIHYGLSLYQSMTRISMMNNNVDDDNADDVNVDYVNDGDEAELL